jgi:Zn-dependent membrane protease YugP
MMLTFGNRWISLSALIRKVHAEIFTEQFKKRKYLQMRYREQIHILNLRLKYVQAMQFFSALSFLFNLLTILIGIYNLKIASFFFIIALIIFSIALFVFLIEINLSSQALKTHIEDLCDPKKIDDEERLIRKE